MSGYCKDCGNQHCVCGSCRVDNRWQITQGFYENENEIIRIECIGGVISFIRIDTSMIEVDE